MKADADRDLYAELELQPTADANEIKRQFKKLGMRLMNVLSDAWLIRLTLSPQIPPRSQPRQ